MSLLGSKESECRTGGLNILGSFCGLGYNFELISSIFRFGIFFGSLSIFSILFSPFFGVPRLSLFSFSGYFLASSSLPIIAIFSKSTSTFYYFEAFSAELIIACSSSYIIF